MATKLTKPIERELLYTDRGRTVIISLEPGDLITFRQKGKRTRYSVSLHKVQLLGLMQHLFDKYHERVDVYHKKKAAGYKNLKRPKPPTLSMFSKFYQEALKYDHK